MIKEIDVFEIEQPIGTFYLGKMSSTDILKISKVDRRLEKNDGIQRDLSLNRVKEISMYCNAPDATFPTPIILSVKTTDTEKIIFEKGLKFQFDDGSKIAEVLDGQHRIFGIQENGQISLDLVVIVMFDLTQEQKAYIFSTINSNQTKVDKSLIFDLFELSESRSPYKTCHDIARILNSNPDSPFYKRLKMLGKKTAESETLSQGTFVTYLVSLISRKPKEDAVRLKKDWKLEDDSYFPLRNIFLSGNDEIILKILLNYFNAVRDVFTEEWNDTDNYILMKTTGFGALIKAFKTFYNDGLLHKSLSYEHFYNQFLKAKQTLRDNNLQLTSQYFPSNEQQQTMLKDYLIAHLNKSK